MTQVSRLISNQSSDSMLFMQNFTIKYRSFIRQILHFIIHLRWHYQIFILSGGFWLGGYISGTIDWHEFLLQFANVHLLLFGGATAYNSYWDKDKGPIGGLKHPPPMQRWMRHVSLILQFIGLIIASQAGWLFMIFYALSILFFWLYSTPHFRWKSKPVGSLFAIGISTGTNSVLLGYLAAGNNTLDTLAWLAAFGTALIILSLYPVSQLFQMDEDYLRGDQTFAIKYGYKGVIRFFRISFSLGILLTGGALAWKQWQLTVIFIVLGLVSGCWIYWQLLSLHRRKMNYSQIMRLKYGCSLAFLCFILGSIILS
jgi:4-hydroxybenzoate polyprenyltransferase